MTTFDILSMCLTFVLFGLLFLFRNRLFCSGVVLNIRYEWFKRKVWRKRHTDTETFLRLVKHDPWLMKKWEKSGERRHT